MSGGGSGSGFVYWARRIRLVIALTCGLPALLFIGYLALSSYLTDPRDLVVLAPDDAGVSVTVDGDHGSLDAGRYGTWKVKKGAHHVHVASDRGTALVDVDVAVGRGWEKYTVIPVRGQCFVTFDVADAWYGSSARKGTPPKVVSRSSDGAPFDEPHGGTYLFTTNTPASIEDGDKVLLVLEAPCGDLLKKNDADLIADAGLIR